MMKEDYIDYDLAYAMQLPPGDCGVFYPGYREAVSCTRLEGYLIGFEDLEMIEELKQKDFAIADQLIKTMIRSYSDYDNSIANYRMTKRTILDALSAK